MAKKRKKSYKKDTAALEKAEAKLAELHTEYDDDNIIEDVLLDMPSAEESAPEKAEPAAVQPEVPVTAEELSEADSLHSAEDDEIMAEISAAVQAAIAEKNSAPKPPVSEQSPAEHSPDEQPEKPKKPEKKKSSKKKAPEMKPLKPIFRIANVVYTAIAFGVITVMFLALPRDDVSVTEQRKLAEFPTFSYETLMNGKYTNGITEYFNDNVPYRDTLKNVAVVLRSFFGISYDDAEIIGPMAVVTEAEEPVPVTSETEQTTTTATAAADISETSVSTTAEVTSETTTTTAETTARPVDTSKNANEIAEGVVTNGQVVTKLSDGHWWGISLYGGGTGATYAAAVNRFKKELGDSVNVYSMVVPTSGEYYLPDKYAAYNASHQKSIDTINSRLDGVIPVPASMALWEHTSEPIYLRTDHHWQPLGAYYAAKCFAETAGVPFADISTMERVDIDGYMGTMYSFTESASLLSDPEVFTYYKPTNSYTTYYYDTAYNFDYQLPFFVKMPTNGSYSTFMGGDKKIVRISTDAGTGRKLVIFKDSYGNAEIPFYFGSFDEIYVCDMRYFDLNGVEFVKSVGATDLMFTMCTFSAVGTNAGGLDKILDNPVTEMTESANQ